MIMTYNGTDTLQLTSQTSTIIACHHFARILENKISGVEVEFEVQAIRGGIREKGRLNKVMRPYIEKMRSIIQLIRDMSNRISNMNDRDQLDYALKLKNQYTGLTTATINKLKLELKDVKEPEKFDVLRSLLLNITTIEMLTDDGSEIEGAINISKNRKNEKISELLNASTTNIIGGELDVVELKNQFIDKYVKQRLNDDIFKLLLAASNNDDVLKDKFDQQLTTYYDDNLDLAISNISSRFEHNEAYDYFVKSKIPEVMHKFYTKQSEEWFEYALNYAEENGL